MGFPVLKLDKPMNVTEFLEWDSGDDRVWELHDGYPILKDGWGPRGHAAPTPRHNAMVGELARLIGNALRSAGLPCRVEPGSGVYRDPDRSRAFYVPDLLVRCGAQAGDGIVLVAEILSPTNTASEMNRKRAFYKEVAAIRDILEFEQDEAACTLLRRRGDVWVEERVAGAEAEALLHLDSIGVDIPLADIYRGIGLDREEEGA